MFAQFVFCSVLVSYGIFQKFPMAFGRFVPCTVAGTVLAFFTTSGFFCPHCFEASHHSGPDLAVRYMMACFLAGRAFGGMD